jgi:hypothetical protein
MLSHMRPLPRTTILIGVLLLAVPIAVSAQATPYVPNLDPAYQDLDALVTEGLVNDEVHAERPYSRLTFGRWVAEAKARARTSGPLPARFREALDRLEVEFAPEIAALCPDGRSACSAPARRVALRKAGADATWSNSPARAVRAPYVLRSAVGRPTYIDAALNPLLQDNQGRRLADGETLGIESSLDVVMGRHFAGELYPRVWASNIAAGSNTGGTAGATLEDGYFRALFGNLAVDLGRNQVEMGQSTEGGPILSYNPRGLDLVRLSMDRPARLPWILRVLGPMEASALVADLGRGSDTPHSKLIVFNGSIHPHPNFEIGATLENHQGGQNAPTATLKQRLEDIFLIYPQGDAISDKAFGANMRLTLPRLRTALYIEGMSTDDHSFFRIEEWSQSLGTEAVWVAGLKRVGLGAEGRFDVWAEARKSGVRPYTHHQFTSGMTLDGRILGDPIGVLAKGATVGVDWTGPTSRLTVAGTWERYYGDSYGQAPGKRLTWVKVADGPDETRERLTADWTNDMGTRRLFTRVRLGLEHVHQFDFVRGDNRVNGMVQVQAGWRW